MSSEPIAEPPKSRNDVNIEVAIAGPFIKSQLKNPMNNIKRTNSAKKSEISPFLKTKLIPVQTKLITAKAQNSLFAALKISDEVLETAV